MDRLFCSLAVAFACNAVPAYAADTWDAASNAEAGSGPDIVITGERVLMA